MIPSGTTRRDIDPVIVIQMTQITKYNIQGKFKKEAPKEKWTNNDLQNIHSKRVTRTPLTTGVSSGAPEGWVVPAPLVSTVMLI
jgi:hypothetical protein